MKHENKELQLGLEYLRSYTQKCKDYDDLVSRRGIYQDYIGEMDDETMRVRENGVMDEQILMYGEKIRQQGSIIYKALDRMPEKYADLVRLHYLEHNSWKETAEALGMEALSAEFRDLQMDACASFWLEKRITGQQPGTSDKVLEAKEYRMWRTYFRTNIAPEEADTDTEGQFLKVKTSLTPRQAQRRMRLLLLTEDWQNRLSTGKIALGTAYEISFLEEDLQHQLSAITDYLHIQPELYHVHKLRSLSRKEWFRQEAVIRIFKPGTAGVNI